MKTIQLENKKMVEVIVGHFLIDQCIKATSNLSKPIKAIKQYGKLSIKRYESYMCNIQGIPSKEAQDQEEKALL